jgi:hypothetical protein
MPISEEALNSKDVYREQDVEAAKKQTKELEDRIEGLLCGADPKNCLEIYNLLQAPESEVCLHESKALMNLKVLSSVAKMQVEKGEATNILQGRSLAEIEEIYQELVFRLRRVEFGKAIDIKQDIFVFLAENRLNVETLLAVLRGTVYLYEKDRIWKSITEGING